MTQVINDLISAIFQLAVFTLIPFVFYLFRKNKAVRFPEYIGLYRATTKSIALVLVVILISIISMIGLALVNEGIMQAMLSPNSVTGKFRAMGFSLPTVISIL